MDDFDYIGFDEEPEKVEDYLGSAATSVDDDAMSEFLFSKAEEEYDNELERQRRIDSLKYLGDAAFDPIPTETSTLKGDDSEGMERTVENHRGYGM